ncbi:hypothetical protein QFC22_004179 [Naganishia vaughanmartiniae]|uniref:Uncharacterized protein n=1 Tax=Naganishia vaughanmartiniae TaxID=1424756 RepID=A0ACC2X2L3_9TREE|nr:hypothetical protein QFC22_004179 [Naganishia vaughanmartiniae]
MDISHSLPTYVKSISFSFLSAKDIRDISVKQITNAQLLDNLNMPTIGGLYDPALGPSDRADICATCQLSSYQCPGHFGHIELPVPVYHPLFMNQAYGLLRSICMYCHKFKMPEIVLKKYIARLRLLDHGLLKESQYIASMVPHARPVTARDTKEEAEGEDSIAVETVEAFCERIDKQVEGFIRGELSIDEGIAEGSSKAKEITSQQQSMGRDSYKDGLVYAERKAVLHEFGRKAYAKCTHCQAQTFTYRKEGTVKIIEYDLSRKHKDQNRALGRIRPDILTIHRKRSSRPRKKQRTTQADDEDSGVGSSEESEGEGEDLMDVDGMAGSADEESEDDSDVGMHENNTGIARGVNGAIKGTRGRDERILPVEEVRAHIREVFKNEPVITGLLYGRHGANVWENGRPGSALKTVPASADIFFMDVLPVPPTRFRPASKMGDSFFENPQNTLLSNVLTTGQSIVTLNNRLREYTNAEKEDIEEDMVKIAVQERTRVFTQLLEAVFQIQHDVNSFMDSSKNPTPMRGGLLPPAGVKQTLEKKEGLFRKHMMGKRVNFAARSVISPDINIETNEIGVPPVFARKLTFPEPVTPHNVHVLRQLVIAGAHSYPGATMVQNEDGTQISLERKTIEERTAIANQLMTPQEGSASSSASKGMSTLTPAINKKVLRHLRDGDILLLNRQPTLHKPSMMAHRARILHGEKTIRMHYANCNSYNADFDGDEMNIHFPQNEVAQAEARMIANTDNQYLGPTSGSPLRGLIQDHVVAAVHLCNKATYLTREQYHQLIYGALRTEDNYTGQGRIHTLPPAMWKPVPRWTGKQVISTIMLNITPPNFQGLNLLSKNKIVDDLWQRGNKDKNMSEEQVEFMDGDLIRGVLDKSQFGASAYGLVHSVFELYGPESAGRLLGILSRLFTKYLQSIAFTCRMDDLILTAEGERIRKSILEAAAGDGATAAMEFVGLPKGSKISDPDTARNLNIRLEEILRDDDMMAGLDGAMQAAFNKTTSKINNDVIPSHLVKPFPDNNMQTMTISGAKGSKVNATQISTLLGQQALEGRRVPTMVSGKTLPSFKAFDTSARAGGYVANRFLTGIRPQEYYFHCMAGREGLIDTAVKTSRSGYLQRCLIKHLEGVRVHYDHTVRDSDQSVLQFYYGEDSLDVVKQKHLYQFEFCARNIDSLANRYKPKEIAGKMDEKEAYSHMKKALKKPYKYSPTMSIYSPSRYLGSMSEKYSAKVDDYLGQNPHELFQPKKDSEEELPHGKRMEQLVNTASFRQLARMRFVRSLVDPGEAVGLLASEGIGEPSTQMTLNTFHLAGHGAANVTLGIPRLREIVMTAAQKPKTPTMKLPLLESVTDEQIDKFLKNTSRLSLSQVVDKVTVTERLAGKTIEQVDRRRTYTVLVEFYPAEEYQEEYNVTAKQIMESLPSSFAVHLQKEITKEFKNTAKALANDFNSVGKGRAVREAANQVNETDERAGRDEELDDDGDAYEMKRKQQSEQVTSYESDEEDNDADMDEEDVLEARIEEDDEAEDGEESQEKADALAKAEADAYAEDVGEYFKSASKFATKFEFDHRTGKSFAFDLEFTGTSQKLLLVDVIERCCRKAVIHEVPNIGRCMKVFNDKGQFTREIITEGSNLPAIWRAAESLIDITRIDSNDIYAILETYGVEAARAAIIKEMSGVFGVYGIAVDYRHLTIVADYMTQEGAYKPFNRTGIATKSSPLLKASFETTAAFLSDATLHGDFDDLRSPSANIVIGAPSKSGTGVFDLRTEIIVSEA